MNFAQCITDFSQEYGLISALFLGGVVGSFTHCAGMCAPFVLAQTGESGLKTEGKKLTRLPHKLLLPYHLGRISTYILLAILFHSVLNLALLFGSMKILLSAFLMSLAGVVFLVNILPSLQALFPWAVRLSIPIPSFFLSRLAAPFMLNPGPFKRYGLGLILGFMPCGLVIAAIFAASTAPNLAQAAFAMTAFGIGTMPALLVVGIGGQTLQNRFPKMKTWVKPAAGLVSALWLFLLAGWMMI